MVLCFLWQSSDQDTIILNLRPDLKNWRQEKYWKPLANYASLLALCSMPRLSLYQEGCFPVTVLYVEPRKLLFRLPIWVKRASWVVGWAVLGCYPVLCARARGTLVPMPSHVLLHGLTRLLAANGPWRATPKSSIMGGGRQGRTFVLLWS